MGKPSVMWLRPTVEELVRFTDLREFYRLFRSGSIILIYIAQWHTKLRIAKEGFRRAEKEEDGRVVLHK